jgi:hypothetical protein
MGFASSEYRLPPTSVPGIDNAIKLSVGQTMLRCAVRNNGHVTCWGGTNQDGEYGTSANGAPHGPTDDVPGLIDAVDVAVRPQGACALNSNGHVTCWGVATNGQNGDGVNGGVNGPYSEGPVLVSGLTDARAITSGAQSTCAIRKDGRVVCWGPDTVVNGDGTLGSALVPQPVIGFD